MPTYSTIRPVKNGRSSPLAPARQKSALGRRNVRILLVSALSPFLGLVLALLHPREPAAKNLVWIFTIFYGTVFYIASWSGADSVRYAESLWFMHNTEFGFGDLAAQFFVDRGSYQDFYQPLVTFVVSRFTDESWLLFGTFGILLGYVYSRNVWFLIDRLPRRPALTVWALIVAFAFVMGIGTSLNGVRMWTALHVFIFGVLYFSDTGNRKYLLIALLSPLIHFSFLIPSLLLVAFLFMRRYGSPIYVFFVASFFVAAIDVEWIRAAAEFLPFTMGERAIDGYIERADLDGLGGIGRERPWWFVFNNHAVPIFMFLAGTWLFLRKVHQRSGAIAFLFLFGLLIYGSVNLVAHVPSAGRFFTIGEMLILASVVLLLADQAKRQKIDLQLATFALPLLAIHIALGVRLQLEFASFWLIAGNFFVAPFVEGDVGIYEFIQALL